jgi:3-dehydroquinate synthase
MILTAAIKRSDIEYPIRAERGALNRLREFLPAHGRAMILTGSGVPSEYAECAAVQLRDADKVTVPDGETAKSIDTYVLVMRQLLENHFDRGDILVALGGGTIGDLAGFAASTFKRGMSLVHVPTTALSQLDSCVGGKTALNLGGIKNAAGTVYQPSAVVIDPELIKTLPKRHLYNGLAEALKAGIIRDEDLFEMLERQGFDMEEVIFRALSVKLSVIQDDESDSSFRQILNLGHTIGHALESVLSGRLLHGECVLWGMLPMLEKQSDRERLLKIIRAWDIPFIGPVDKDQIFELVLSDKKVRGDTITVSAAERIGHAELKRVPVGMIRQYINIASEYWGADR